MLSSFRRVGPWSLHIPFVLLADVSRLALAGLIMVTPVILTGVPDSKETRDDAIPLPGPRRLSSCIKANFESLMQMAPIGLILQNISFDSLV